MSTKAKWLGAAALGLALFAGCAWWMMGRTPAVPAAPVRTLPVMTWLLPFAPSMAGTRPDGAARQDDAQRLTVDAELAHLFDYYLAGLGERELAAIRSEIERELERRLSAAAAAEAKRLLARYLAYKAALVGLEATLPPVVGAAPAADQRLQAMRKLRRDYFSADEIAGLFGAADAYDDDAAARAALVADGSLDPAQRQQRLIALERQLPAGLRASRAAAGGVLALEASVQQLRAQGADDNEIYRTRALAFSPAAADRLAQVDREDADWQRRIALYRAGRARSADGGGAVQRLRDELFTPDEQRRLAAYE